MSKEEIMAKFQPKKCGSQVEFDAIMEEMNREQTLANHPGLDRLREIGKQRALIKVQIDGLRQQLSALRIEAIDIEQQNKERNRLFHQLKHELIEINPKGLKGETKEAEDAA